MYLLPRAVLMALAIGSPAMAQGAAKPPPGACEAPARDNAGKPGCYLTGELRVPSPPAELYWHISLFGSDAEARKEAARHKLTFVAPSHGQVWLYVLGARDEAIGGGEHKATVGPIRRTSGKPHIARFLEADFTPGMMTRTHSHAGPEAFYVVSGEQCMETPTERKMLKAGETYVVESGVHLQAAPKGRKNLVLVLHEEGAPWTTVETGWTPTDFCNG